MRQEIAFGEEALRFGEIHRCLLKAVERMEVDCWKRPFTERTEFGEEVGLDEIHWWVFKKETDLGELKRRTTAALESAQKIKQAAELHLAIRRDSLGEIAECFNALSAEQAEHIRCLQYYVEWLRQRDVLAPSILITYRVWGSTRLSDKIIGISSESRAEDIASVVFGFCSRGLWADLKARFEIGAEIYESGAENIYVPDTAVGQRASREIFSDFYEYCVLIRDSLRNILLDVEKCKIATSLLDSERFWRRFIEKVVSSNAVEGQHWDAKETLEMWHVKKHPAKAEAEIRFAERVAAFANARGGIILVGVGESPKRLVGIGDEIAAERRFHYVAHVIAARLKPSSSEIRIKLITVQSKDGGPATCLVLAVPRTHRTVFVDLGSGDFRCVVRRGTGLDRVTETYLADKTHLKADDFDFLAELEQFANGR